MTLRPVDPEIAKNGAQREVARMDYEASLTQASERLRFQQETAIAAIKGLTLANGGAIISLLTFIGNSSADYSGADLKTAFSSFAIGLGFALASYLGAYYSQSWFMFSDMSTAWDYQRDMQGESREHTEMGNKERRRGWIAQLFGLACITSSLGMFIYGAFMALEGIL